MLFSGKLKLRISSLSCHCTKVKVLPLLINHYSDNFKKSFMKACLCARGKDLNAQLQVENSIFPRFGRSRGSEKLTSFAKKNMQHSANVNNNNTTNGGGVKDSEALVIAASERDKKNINFSSIGSVCVVKTSTSANGVTSNVVACNVSAANNAATYENNKEINGCETAATMTTKNHQRAGQRTQILHTDL